MLDILDGNRPGDQPGNHLDVALTIDGRSAIGSYSAIGAVPQDDAWRIAVRRVADSRGGSRAMWSLAPGATVRVTRPSSHSSWASDARSTC